MKAPITEIAKVCHEANRAFCQTMGDDSQPTWEDAPEWQKTSAQNGVQFHLDQLQDGKEPEPSASHNNWMAEKEAAGWTYGEEKNPDKKEHPCMMPYDMLPVQQRQKDYIFGAIVKAYFDCRA